MGMRVLSSPQDIMLWGGEIMSSLTTVADKDNIIFELIWI